MDCIIAFVDQWQTLIAGVVAIAAAFIGGYFINQQMLQTAMLEADRRARELAAARAMLPLHLASMVGHTRLQARALMRLRHACGGMGLPNSTFIRETFPEVAAVPPQTAVFFENMVLKCEAKDRSLFAEILEEVQVSDSRIANLREEYLEPGHSVRVITADELDSHILQLADIHARCDALFPYARAAETLHEPTAAQLSSALMNMGLRDHAFPTVFAELNRRAERRARTAQTNEGSEATVSQETRNT